MTTKTKIIIGVGSAVALIASYLIYKKMSSDKGEENPPKKGEENTATNNSECKRYVVTNVSNYVNVRSTPSTTLKEISTLKKGSTVSAKPSSTSGWMELCEMQGFVSSKFLTPENSTSNASTTTTTDQNCGLKKLELFDCDKDTGKDYLFCYQKFLHKRTNKIFYREINKLNPYDPNDSKIGNLVWMNDKQQIISFKKSNPETYNEIFLELEKLYQAKKFC